MFNKLDELQAQFEQQRDEDLKQDNKLLHGDQRKVLNSLKNHWDGLSEFKSDANIPFENNAAERALRSAVVGRKGYYGSGSVWSANLTQMLFSIFVTLQMANFNLCIWLNDYLQACTQNQGKAPQHYADFLPWNMSEDTLISYQQKAVSYKNPNQIDSS